MASLFPPQIGKISGSGFFGLPIPVPVKLLSGTITMGQPAGFPNVIGFATAAGLQGPYGAMSVSTLKGHNITTLRYDNTGGSRLYLSLDGANVAQNFFSTISFGNPTNETFNTGSVFSFVNNVWTWIPAAYNVAWLGLTISVTIQ